MKSTSLQFYNNIPIHTFKHIIEICMDRVGLYKEVAEATLGAEFRTEGAEKPKGFKDISVAKIAEYHSTENNVIDEEDVTVDMIFDYLAQARHVAYQDLVEVKKQFLEYISLKSQIKLIDEYINTKMTQERMKLTIIRLIEGKYNTNLRAAVEANIEDIMALYKKHVSSSMYNNFDIRSQSVLSYITHDIREYFWKSNSRAIFALLNRKSFRKNVQGEEYDYADDIRVEKLSTKPLVGFTEHASNIYDVSSKIFNHSHEICYDLWSRYKFKVAQERFNNLNKKSNEFNLGVNLAEKLELFDGNYTDYSTYRKVFVRRRLVLLDKLDGFIDSGLLKCDYKKVFDALMVEDATVDDKDNKRMFSHGPSPKRGRSFTDEELFFALLKGASSVRAIAAHCNACGIDPLSIPSDIFTRSDLIIRNPTFEEYMATYKTTEELIAEAPLIGTVDGIAHNEDICRGLFGLNSTEQYTISQLKQLSFSDIKTMLFSPAKKQNYSLNIAETIKTPENKKLFEELLKYTDSWSLRLDKYTQILLQVDAIITKQTGKDPTLAQSILFKTKTYSIVSGGNLVDKTVIASWKNIGKNLMSKLSNVKAVEEFFSVEGKKIPIQRAIESCCETPETLVINQFRFLSLTVALLLRLRIIYANLLDAKTTNIDSIVLFERYASVLNLPSTITSLDDLRDLFDSTDKFFPSSVKAINADTFGTSYARVMSLIVASPEANENVAIGELEFKSIYGKVYSMLKKFIEPLREIRDNFYVVLDSSITATGSVFGEYQNDLKDFTKIMNTTVSSNIQFPAIFREYQRKSIPESILGHGFLAVEGKAVCVYKQGYRYFVHTTGQLYCPDLKNTEYFDELGLINLSQDDDFVLE